MGRGIGSLLRRLIRCILSYEGGDGEELYTAFEILEWAIQHDIQSRGRRDHSLKPCIGP